MNGGKKWERTIIQLQIECDRCSNTADIAFLDNNQGWAVINGLYTSTSWVWHSVDGGKTWQSHLEANRLEQGDRCNARASANLATSICLEKPAVQPNELAGSRTDSWPRRKRVRQNGGLIPQHVAAMI